MSKNKIIFILALLIALLPHTGFPRSWSSVLFTLFGLAIAGLSLRHRDQSAEFFSRQAYEKDEQTGLADARAFSAEEIAHDERADEAVTEVPLTAEKAVQGEMPAPEEPPKRRLRQAARKIKKEKIHGEENVSSADFVEAPSSPSGAVSEEFYGNRA